MKHPGRILASSGVSLCLCTNVTSEYLDIDIAFGILFDVSKE